MPPQEPASEIQSAIKQFPCGQCGAKLKFVPGTLNQKCDYCGFVNQISESENNISELDFEAQIKTLAEKAPRDRVMNVRCKGCGASVTLPPNITSSRCPFCASNVVAQEALTQIQPGALLPFHINEKLAREKFIQWISSLWFAPTSLRRLAHNDSRLSGVYVPYWTFDSKTTSQYTGQRGDDYWTTETYYSNGKLQTRSVKHTRWSYASGVVRNTFDDVLVLASNSLPRPMTEKLEPWDTRNVIPYSQEFLAGFGAESYQIDLPEGYALARLIMNDFIRATIRADIGGDHQRITTVKTQHDDVTFKHILLPIWISAYQFHAKSYRFLINGRTGEVQGERPWSYWKLITLALGVLAIIGVVVALANR